MVCGRCGNDVGEVAIGIRRGAGRQPWRVDRLRGILCPHCGEVLYAIDTTDRLVGKLCQLAQFGLNGDGPVLLEPMREFRAHR